MIAVVQMKMDNNNISKCHISLININIVLMPIIKITLILTKIK